MSPLFHLSPSKRPLRHMEPSEHPPNYKYVPIYSYARVVQEVRAFTVKLGSLIPHREAVIGPDAIQV